MSKLRSSHKTKDKLRAGNVLGDTFEFFDENRMEVVTLKTVQTFAPHQQRCPDKCHFKTLQSESKKLEDAAKNCKGNESLQHRHRSIANSARCYVCRDKIWPCAIHSCEHYKPKRVLNEDGKLSERPMHLCVHYELQENKTGENDD